MTEAVETAVAQERPATFDSHGVPEVRVVIPLRTMQRVLRRAAALGLSASATVRKMLVASCEGRPFGPVVNPEWRPTEAWRAVDGRGTPVLSVKVPLWVVTHLRRHRPEPSTPAMICAVITATVAGDPPVAGER